MTNIFTAQNQKNIPQRQKNSTKEPQTHGDVWQDNGASLGRRFASTQPGPHHEDKSDTLLTSIGTHAQKKNKRRQPLQKITARVKPEVKAELERIARQWKVKGKSVSLSAVIDIFLKRAVQGHIDMQYGALLKPTIEKTIRDETRSQRLFMAVFLARLAL